MADRCSSCHARIEHCDCQTPWLTNQELEVEVGELKSRIEVLEIRITQLAKQLRTLTTRH